MKSLLVLFAVVACAYGGFLHAPLAYHAPIAYHAPLAYAAPYIGGSQYKAQDILGQYTYGYATGNGISKAEAGGIDGSVAGGFAYTSPEGKRIDIKYTAGADGFKASGDAIPVAPAQTPEVAKATAEHLMAKDEAARKAAEAPKEIAIAAPLAYAHPLAYNHAYAHPLAYAHHPLAYKAAKFGYAYAA